ncbi:MULTISPECIES: N4-gp56 family major capsid protein [Streptosporangium]|uniref:N4-gp56 family major capsid protein n=1 Tax=Streptosporangium brasiliense TaxID=47480 RepID=A0ABT9RM09_9ACTN|nr:N4-gp56 family major capsid protein [Streptosporangium brasiliense]MDP9870332.1 N4-gp56 family major capsid protein [Streptosporangium brasiliense]
MAFNGGFPTTSAITGTPNLATNVPGSMYGAGSGLGAAIATIWSKEILFSAMPILRYEQFAVKRTELGVQPGLTINFMRYNNLPDAKQLVEGVRMETYALSASQFSITVAEHGMAVAVSEMLLNASYDDILSSASRLLGRNMALYLDRSARNTLLKGSSVLYGYDKLKQPAGAITSLSPYDLGSPAAGRSTLTDHYFTTALVKDGVQTLAQKNIPRLGETYVCFVSPSQSRKLRDDPSWIEMTKYASPGNFALGEIGRIDDVVFIETTQVRQLFKTGEGPVNWNTADTAADVATGKSVYQAQMIGDNAFGHAISLPVELRDGGVLDHGREHSIAWYSVWGLGVITDNAIVTLETN